MAPSPTTRHLHILIANERQSRLSALSDAVSAAGHEVSARLISASAVIPVLTETQPDLAIVALGSTMEHALELVAEIIDEAECPVIVVLEKSDPEFVARAAELGVFGHLTEADAPELQSAIEVALHRFSEYEGLRRAFARRILVERAKGMLMERHGISERHAFERIRDAARRRRVPVVSVAEDVLAGRSGDRL
jgi:AmiR/NasT family two-component response regulator